MSSGVRDAALQALFAKIARDRGFACDAYKESCLRRRLAVRMRARGVHTYQDYATVLDRDAGEYDSLLDTLTINVTKFYRNAETWTRLADGVLPGVWTRRGGSVRAWSVGCASGEEPYTLAILLLEQQRRDPRQGLPHIDATDLDRRSLARAGVGVYPSAALDEMPVTLVQRYFEAPDAELKRRILPDVRRAVHFRRHDVLREPPPVPPYDVIMCRNVVIYFDRPTQERLFLAFVEALAPEGILVLGKVETLFGAARDRLSAEDTRERIYRLT